MMIRCRQTGRIAGILLAIGATGAVAQSPSERLADLERRNEAAQGAAVHLLAPRAYDEAADRLRDAQRRVADGADDARERLSRAEQALEVAEATADRVRGRFDESLAARRRAMEEDAERRVPPAWEAAEEAFARGGRDAERDDFDGIAETDRRTAELYRRAHAAARSDRLLGTVGNARQVALSAGASELAPRTFAAGEAALADGQSGLASATDEVVERDGDRAMRAFRRAAWVAALSDSVRNRTLSLERLIDAHEADLARLADAAGVPMPDLQREDDTTAEELDRAIRDLLDRNADLAATLRAEQATSAQLSDQVASLELALTDSERRYSESRAALLDRQARDARLRETSALFTEDEGEVFLSGDDLVLRLHGLTFESGSDEVDESMEPLLAKVQRVLIDYSDATIRIEGHTDSQGNPDRNRTLSQSRAVAIREYLLGRLPISSSRVEAVGHGEDRPIARNDTEAGRARNRRIEIILTVPPGD
jgi:outer membrane protein OmpA-like peptidoglycan-associated protein